MNDTFSFYFYIPIKYIDKFFNSKYITLMKKNTKTGIVRFHFDEDP